MTTNNSLVHFVPFNLKSLDSQSKPRLICNLLPSAEKFKSKQWNITTVFRKRRSFKPHLLSNETVFCVS